MCIRDRRHLVGVLLGVWVRARLVPHVRAARASTAAVGVLGVMGNKGAAAVRFELFDSTFCFVCGHLAAHRENVDGRNADVTSIVAKLRFAGARRASMRADADAAAARAAAAAARARSSARWTTTSSGAREF